MLYLFSLLAGLAFVVDYPWVRELLLGPMDDERRNSAPGAFVELSGGMTHYQWHGPRSPNVLVLIHGLSYPSWVFDGVIRGLVAMGYHVLTYDLYGRGYSDRPKGRQSLDFHIRQLDELLVEVGVTGPVSLLGYSMGGMIASTLAAKQPDRVERLILVAPAGLNYTPFPLTQRAVALGPLGAWLWGMFAGRSLQRAAQQQHDAGSVIEDLPRRVSQELNTRGYLPALLSSEHFTLTRTLEEPLTEVQAMYIPTLAIWGEKDIIVPQTAPGLMSKWHRTAQQDVIAGAGHGLIHTHPRQILSAVKAFQNQVPD
ncbi:MAG: alpha/beta hydrolase [Maritimibacter sp.]